LKINNGKNKKTKTFLYLNYLNLHDLFLNNSEKETFCKNIIANISTPFQPKKYSKICDKKLF
jgi:hypothetical protein